MRGVDIGVGIRLYRNIQTRYLLSTSPLFLGSKLTTNLVAENDKKGDKKSKRKRRKN